MTAALHAQLDSLGVERVERDQRKYVPPRALNVSERIARLASERDRSVAAELAIREIHKATVARAEALALALEAARAEPAAAGDGRPDWRDFGACLECGAPAQGECRTSADTEAKAPCEGRETQRTITVDGKVRPLFSPPHQERQRPE